MHKLKMDVCVKVALHYALDSVQQSQALHPLFNIKGTFHPQFMRHVLICCAHIADRLMSLIMLRYVKLVSSAELVRSIQR